GKPSGVPAAAAAVRSAMSSFDDLISKHLHGLATAEEQKDLDRLLSESPHAADAYARASRLDQALDRHFHHEQAISGIQFQIHRREKARFLKRLAAVAGLLIAAGLSFFLLRPNPPLAMSGETALHAGDAVTGPATLTFPGEPTTIRLAPGAELILKAPEPGKNATLKRGRLTATVSKQLHPMTISTPSASIMVLGTRFTLTARESSTRLEVTEGKVHLSRRLDEVDVSAGEAAEAGAALKLAKTNLYEDRFATLWRT